MVVRTDVCTTDNRRRWLDRPAKHPAAACGRADKRTTQSRGGSRCVDSCSCSALPCSLRRSWRSLPPRRGPGRPAARCCSRSPSIRPIRTRRASIEGSISAAIPGRSVLAPAGGCGHVRGNGSGQRQVADDPHLRRLVGHAHATRIDRGGKGRVGRRGRRGRDDRPERRRRGRAARTCSSAFATPTRIRATSIRRRCFRRGLRPRVGPPTTGGTVQPPSAVSVPTSTTPVDGRLRHDRSGCRWNCDRRGSAGSRWSAAAVVAAAPTRRVPAAAAAPAAASRSTDRRLPAPDASATGVHVAPAVEPAASSAARRGGHTGCGACSRRVAGLSVHGSYLDVAATADGCAEPIDGRLRRRVAPVEVAVPSHVVVAHPRAATTADRRPGSTSAGREPRRSLPWTGRSLRISASPLGAADRHSRRLARATHGRARARRSAPRRLDARTGVTDRPAFLRWLAAAVPGARARVAARDAPPTGGSATRSYDCPR